MGCAGVYLSTFLGKAISYSSTLSRYSPFLRFFTKLYKDDKVKITSLISHYLNYDFQGWFCDPNHRQSTSQSSVDE